MVFLMKLSWTTWVQTASERALDLLFPATCVSCQADLDSDDLKACEQELSLCVACHEQLLLPDWPACRRCAARVPEIPGTVSDCGQCRTNKLCFDRALSLDSYEGLLRELVIKMKSDRSERLARMFSSLMVRKMGPAIRDLGPTVVVPIPVSRWRRLVQGAGSAAALAAGVGRGIGLPVLPRVLSCRHNPHPQKGLSRSGRFQNMRGQIRARAGYPLMSSHVLLVDDVLTTGATCSEAARVLKQRGATRVSVLAVGRTPSG